ncbi:MAG: sigma-70 family RNA polymerase sigma factor [Planctomycetota bacterium]
MQEPSTEMDALIDRARHRDKAAMTELFDACSQRLLESVRAELGERVRQRLESRDVMQQVYLDALGSIDQFVDRGNDAFFQWLRRIAVNRICDADRRSFRTERRGAELRAADVAGRTAMDMLFAQVSGSITSPSGVAGRADSVQRLSQALEKLGADQQQAIRLRYLSQLSVAETAERMDRSEKAVRSLCVRALIQLREVLGED